MWELNWTMGPALALVVFWLFMRPPWKRPLTILPFSITVRTWPVPSLTFKFYTWDICVPSIVLTNLGITTTNCMVIKCLCSCSTQKDPRSHRNSKVGMGMILIVCFQFEVNLSKMQFISNQDYKFYSHQSTSVKPLSRMTFPLAVLEARYVNFFSRSQAIFHHSPQPRRRLENAKRMLIPPLRPIRAQQAGSQLCAFANSNHRFNRQQRRQRFDWHSLLYGRCGCEVKCARAFSWPWKHNCLIWIFEPKLFFHCTIQVPIYTLLLY